MYKQVIHSLIQFEIKEKTFSNNKRTHQLFTHKCRFIIHCDIFLVAYTCDGSVAITKTPIWNVQQHFSRNLINNAKLKIAFNTLY